jgi:hypothetical protein
LQSFTGAKNVVVSDTGNTGRPDLVLPVPDKAQHGGLAEDGAMEALAEFFADIVVIEDWAGVELPIPLVLEDEDVRNIATIAADIKRGGFDATLTDFEVTGDQRVVEQLHEGHPIGFENPIGATIFGQHVELGYKMVVVTGYRVTSVEPAEAPEDFLVRMEPATEEARHIAVTLSQSPTRTEPPEQGKDEGG